MEKKTAVITGASGGLGRSLCFEFAGAGYRIIALDLDAKSLKNLSSEAVQKKIDLETIVCDITNPVQVQKVFRKIEKFGVDVLINNAGITHRSPFLETDPAVLERVMRVNFFGSVLCTRAALPSLLKSRGSLIGIASVAGFAPLVARSGYSASKHALTGFLETLRCELMDSGVHVLVVSPSFIETPIAKNALDAQGDTVKRSKVTFGKVLSSSEAARAILEACLKRKKRARIGGVARLSWWIYKFFPAIYERTMIRSFEKEMVATAGKSQ